MTDRTPNTIADDWTGTSTAAGRWDGITRDYTKEAVARLRGSPVAV